MFQLSRDPVSVVNLVAGSRGANDDLMAIHVLPIGLKDDNSYMFYSDLLNPEYSRLPFLKRLSHHLVRCDA